MSRLIPTTLLLLICLSAGAQSAKKAPIKVYLLGTFHFNQTDTTIFDIKSVENQKDVLKLCQKIESFQPDKVFIERMPDYEYENKIDSMYQLYRKEGTTKKRNEIWQVAARVASDLGHDSLYQCDHPGSYGSIYQELAEYAEQNNQTDILESRAKGTTATLDSHLDRDSLFANCSLPEILRLMNSKAYQESSHAHYINVFPQIGNTNVYNYDSNYMLGTALTVDWYKRNITIYAKIINQLTYDEKAIFLIIGNDHVPIIRQLFRENPYFEVIETSKWLKKL